MQVLASIPSPSSGTLDVGPLTIHMYGLMLLAGIAACIAITGRRWVARGGDWDLIFRVAVWGVGAGIVEDARAERDAAHESNLRRCVITAAARPPIANASRYAAWPMLAPTSAAMIAIASLVESAER